MSSVRIGVDVMGRRYFLDCDVDDAGDIHALARQIDAMAHDMGAAVEELDDAEILLRVALQLMADVAALKREPDFVPNLDALTRRIEALTRRLETGAAPDREGVT